MAPFQPPSAAPKCPACGKSVYAAEEVKASGQSWHALCFCCGACGKSLRGGARGEALLRGLPSQALRAQGHRLRQHPGRHGRGLRARRHKLQALQAGGGGLPARWRGRCQRCGRRRAGCCEGGGAGGGGGGRQAAVPEGAHGRLPEVRGGWRRLPTSGLPPALRRRAAQLRGRQPQVPRLRSAPPPVPGRRRGDYAPPEAGLFGKSVYAAEEVKGLGKSWHALCFCCKGCGKSLRGGQFKEHGDWPYCEACHTKSFGPKGIGYGSTLGDTGVGGVADAVAEPKTAVAEEAERAPAVESRARGSTFKPVDSAAPVCPKCGKRVYAAEEVRAGGRSWHGLCFCCGACGRSLRGGQFREHEGQPYCEACHGKQFGVKGIGYGSTLGDTGVAGTPDAVSS